MYTLTTVSFKASDVALHRECPESPDPQTGFRQVHNRAIVLGWVRLRDPGRGVAFCASAYAAAATRWGSREAADVCLSGLAPCPYQLHSASMPDMEVLLLCNTDVTPTAALVRAKSHM